MLTLSKLQSYNHQDLNRFLANIVNKAIFYTLKMVLEKRPVETIIRFYLSFEMLLLVILCHLENWFFHLYVSLKSFHARTSEEAVRRCPSK